ncbi:MAG TPA: threonine--tRNA ligase [Chloroflexota bacterium]|nr:threonine--tRNA ligase [Chloroflexota bacterium]
MADLAESYEGDIQSSGASDLDAMRHSLAHVMAEAVLKLFPDARLGIGPWIEHGFYYDFELPRSLTPDDLEKVEALMRERIAAASPFERTAISLDEARRIFHDQPFKLELIEGFKDQALSTFQHAAFVDLCRGPHVADTGKIGAFKLLSVAGAYWRGDEHRPMLQRIYGAAFNTQEELDAHLHRLEQARLRDHRKLGKELRLFTFSEHIGPGLPLFLPRGEMLRHLMEGYVREAQTRYGYQHVWTGHMVKRELYARSGHLEHYGDVMFPPMVDGDQAFMLKPMNCPSHMTLFNTEMHSYRDLPVRYAEFCTLYRYERSGELSGLTRVRSLTQDDCHIFCTPEQVGEEFGRALDLIREVLDTYGFTDYRVQLSLRDPSGGKFVDDAEKWTLAETALRQALDAKGVKYTPVTGEAAFYGPKADFMARDVLGREWQLSTIQVDFIQPARLGVEYIGEDGKTHTPVVLHRAVTGSTERFMGVVIEHFGGAFPLWLSPVQALVLPIADRHNAYAAEIADRFKAAGLRAEVDGRSERLQYKIREAQMQKTPYMLIVGDNEAANNTASVRDRAGAKRDAAPLDTLIGELVDLSVRRAL